MTEKTRQQLFRMEKKLTPSHTLNNRAKGIRSMNRPKKKR